MSAEPGLIEAVLFQEEGGDEVRRTNQRRRVDQGGGRRQVHVLRGEDGQPGAFFCDVEDTGTRGARQGAGVGGARHGGRRQEGSSRGLLGLWGKGSERVNLIPAFSKNANVIIPPSVFLFPSSTLALGLFYLFKSHSGKGND